MTATDNITDRRFILSPWSLQIRLFPAHVHFLHLLLPSFPSLTVFSLSSTSCARNINKNKANALIEAWTNISKPFRNNAGNIFETFHFSSERKLRKKVTFHWNWDNLSNNVSASFKLAQISESPFYVEEFFLQCRFINVCGQISITPFS